MNGPEILTLYEHVAVVTADMLDAARSNDWDRLVQLETVCSRHVQSLRENDPPPALAGRERERKIELISRILANDREIRTLTEPWMKRLSIMINSAGAERKLSQAYGANQVY